jgi:hypothetical protein
MESCSNQKSVKQNQDIVEILQIATLCLDDNFAHSWHSLNQLQLEYFSNSLEGVSTNAEHLLVAFSSLGHLNLVEVGGLWRPGLLMQHSITLLLGKVALTQPGGVLDHCPVEKLLIVPISPNQMVYRCRMLW